jgi:hypothetical protein
VFVSRAPFEKHRSVIFNTNAWKVSPLRFAMFSLITAIYLVLEAIAAHTKESYADSIGKVFLDNHL